MLVIDAFLTLLTWLPYNIYPSIMENRNLMTSDMDTIQFRVTVFHVLTAMMLTNVFSTPIVYLIFNRHFRVRTTFIYYLLLLFHLYFSCFTRISDDVRIYDQVCAYKTLLLPTCI